MIFVGDVSIAQGDRGHLLKFPQNLLEQKWCVNLEGAISDEHHSKGFYNSWSGFSNLREDIDISNVFLANNHINDIRNGLKGTLSYLDVHGLKPVGLSNQSNPYNFKQNLSIDSEIVVFGYGWEAIGCYNTFGRLPQFKIAILSFNDILTDVKLIMGRLPNSRIVICLHASYELDSYIQPLHRELAHGLIDIGVYAVLFHHSHVAGPIELYKGKIIAHGLGNWLASRGRFFKGDHHYPSECDIQIGVEIHETGEPLVHTFETKDGLNIKYIDTKTLSYFCTSKGICQMNSWQYKNFYKKNGKKSFLLPVFLNRDDKIVNVLKLNWIKFRHIIIQFLVLVRLKRNSPRALNKKQEL